MTWPVSHRAPTSRLLLFSHLLKTSSEVILEVKAGEGGDDSKLFAETLFTAQVKFATSQGLHAELLSADVGHFVARVSGPRVWAILSPEVGTHCVQRVPPTETKGRRHTSYLSVAVLPILRQVTRDLNMDEVKVTTQGGSGPGGQHQNMRDSAVRMTHRPTGIQVFINGRDQHANRAEAERILAARVHDHFCQLQNSEYRELRMSQMGRSGRGQKCRTYNYLDGRAVDHRNGKRANVKAVIGKGQLGLLR